jgi:hypothetical protein
MNDQRLQKCSFINSSAIVSFIFNIIEIKWSWWLGHDHDAVTDIYPRQLIYYWKRQEPTSTKVHA